MRFLAISSLLTLSFFFSFGYFKVNSFTFIDLGLFCVGFELISLYFFPPAAAAGRSPPPCNSPTSPYSSLSASSKSTPPSPPSGSSNSGSSSSSSIAMSTMSRSSSTGAWQGKCPHCGQVTWVELNYKVFNALKNFYR